MQRERERVQSQRYVPLFHTRPLPFGKAHAENASRMRWEIIMFCSRYILTDGDAKVLDGADDELEGNQQPECTEILGNINFCYVYLNR